ncbi:MAG: nucleotidyltransferase family protein [Acidobacteriota bacterium]
MNALAIVPAAGKAERFGGGKLIADIDGEPLLNRTLRSLIDGGVEKLVVVLAPGATFTTVQLLSDPRVRRVVNPNPERGMFSSILIGLAAEDGDPILVLPGDMPFVKAETVGAMLNEATRTGRIVSPRFGGRHGHPVAFPGTLKAEILKADVASTLATVLQAHHGQRTSIEVSDPGVHRDVDARADLASIKSPKGET